MSAWAWLVANPRIAARVVGYGTLALCIGLLILRAERAERLLAEARTEASRDHWQLEVCKGDRESYASQLQGWHIAAAKEAELRAAAERKARAVRIRTVERVRAVREAAVPADCTAAIEWAATEAPRVAEWGGKL